MLLNQYLNSRCSSQNQMLARAKALFYFKQNNSSDSTQRHAMDKF